MDVHNTCRSSMRQRWQHFVSLVGGALILLAASGMALAIPADYTQCANDDGDGYNGDPGVCDWTGGNLQANNSTYHEGDATPQRLYLKLVPGDYTLTITYNVTKAGKHAYDYLTDMRYSEDWISDADLCSAAATNGFDSIASCASITPDTYVIPAGTVCNAGSTATPSGSFAVKNADITLISLPAPYPTATADCTGDQDAAIVVSFTVSASCEDRAPGANGTCPVLFYWGAHISKTDEYNEPTAVTINGSPYHVAFEALNGDSTGRRDNQMQANAVVDLCADAATRCNDNNACTTDSCDPATGACSNVDNVTPTCDDGNACTTDSCNTTTGLCQNIDNVTPTCNDNNACTVDSCNTTTGLCQHIDNVTPTCDDGNACTVDSCNTTTGLCQHIDNVTPTCNDNNACTVDSCNTTTGLCQHVDNVTPTCDDGNACTTDSCNTTTGLCQHVDNVTPTCNDNNACTVDSCNTTTGLCQHVDNVTPTCDDGNACTTDSCNTTTGLCQHVDNVTPTCDDGNACTTDSCNTSTGLCQHIDNVTPTCDDGNACTTDSCNTTTGLCQNIDEVTPTCDDSDICTADSCNTTTGQCVHEFDPTADPSCAPGICRTPGFWGTHADITQDVLDAVTGGSLNICGQCIASALPYNDAASAVEALCIAVRGTQSVQLARQLTAAALNCVMTDGNADCSGTANAELFAACNAACPGSTVATVGGQVVDCIAALDCANNGGAYDTTTGYCKIGDCVLAGADVGDCSLDHVCAPVGGVVPTCVPTPGNCHDQPLCSNSNEALCFPNPGPATSAKECQQATKSTCTIFGGCAVDSCGP